MGNLYRVRGPAQRALMLRAAGTSVLLSAVFLVVYGSTNWLTAQRPDAHIRTWYFAWEPAVIPYVPLLIVPYMSIDLFFFLAAFLCRDERELRVFAQRVLFSILTAGAFFLLLPLKLAWPGRPRIDGWFGDLVEASCTAPFLMEYPHNLFPTLHITLCMILADIYGRHTRRIVRVLSYTWFSLIAVSTILTWQHHLIDAAGGFLLAAFAFHLFRESAPRIPVVANVRIGCYYAAAAAGALALAPVTWPWGVFLLWPAAGLGMVAAAYFGRGPGIFRKTDGRLPLSTRVVLAPVLIGQYLSLVYYRRRCRAWDEVAPGVLIGRRLTDAEARAATQTRSASEDSVGHVCNVPEASGTLQTCPTEEPVTAVLDLTAEMSEAAPFLDATYCNIAILDLTGPTPGQLQQAVDFITEQAARGVVYVHCKIGYSRSAAVVGAYLLASREAATVDEAVAQLRQARPSIIIRPEAMEALHDFARAAACGLRAGPYNVGAFVG